MKIIMNYNLYIIIQMKKFAHIKKGFRMYNETVKYPSGYEEVKIWWLGRGIRMWLNDRDVDGKFLKIRSYTELKKKITDRLKLMGYSDVSEIPEDIQITIE
jgi:hypothetical protein